MVQGEIQPKDTAEFDLFLISRIIVDYLLFYYRIMLHKAWEGKISTSLTMRKVGRRHLEIKPSDPFRRLDSLYKIPTNQIDISISFQGFLEQIPDMELTMENPVMLLCSSIILKIVHNFGFTPIKKYIQQYLKEILKSLTKFSDSFITKHECKGVVLEGLKLKKSSLI